MRDRLQRTIDCLEVDPWPALDVDGLVGFEPWLRIREGNYRIILRPLTDSELHTLNVPLPVAGYYVARAIDKQYVQRVLRGLSKASSPALKPPASQ